MIALARSPRKAGAFEMMGAKVVLADALDDEFAPTNRLRTEVTDTLLAAARVVGARRFIAPSFCGWPFAREGGPVRTEEDRLDPDPPFSFRKTLAAIRYLYGPGTAIAKGDPVVELVRRRRIPIVGAGAGVWSLVHIGDAARATVAAVSRGEPGIYNVVDDEPAPVRRGCRRSRRPWAPGRPAGCRSGSAGSHWALEVCRR